MNDTPRRIVVGYLPGVGSDVQFVGGEDPVAVMIREAGAKLDRQRAAEARALAAKAAEIERAKNTRRARAARRFKRALTALARLK